MNEDRKPGANGSASSPGGATSGSASDPNRRADSAENLGDSTAPDSGSEGSSQPGGAGSLLPAISLPTGGGAIRGIGEKFEVNAVTGTAGLTVPLPSSPGRNGQGPQISLSYSSGGGNGPFGLGFSLSVPMITRKTDKGLPRYLDEPNSETDTFLLSGAEDLVPQLDAAGGHKFFDRGSHLGYLYRPRIEGLFARIERLVPKTSGEVYWRVTTPDNVTHIYGTDPDSQVVDPKDPSRTMTWYLAETRDDKGNVTRYEYKREDGAGVDPTRLSERSRFDYSSNPPTFEATAQTYLKRVLYGNKVPGVGAAVADFLFELVFDYGEHAAATSSDVPVPDDTAAGISWPVRSDPFSTHRAGFEMRTYRLCRRVLMFHRIDTPQPLLVRSTDLTYEEGPSFTYLREVEQAGYLLDENAVWKRQTMPRLSLDYQRPELQDELLVVPETSLEGLVGGTDGARKQWVDLDGEGIPGVLIDQGGAWFYKENRGSGELKAPRRLPTLPQPSALASGAQTLEDIDGDGRLELVSRSRSLQGYFARTTDGDFEPLRAFESVPNVNWNDPNLRIIDLDGDGHGDILITEDQAFVWYRSRAKQGFEQSKRVTVSFDENQGPRVVFSDAEQSIQLADMSGDGLVDIVRVRNGEICYWPNLGYGRFGKKITLENSPLFTNPEEFHASRVRFFDVDGSGTSDLFYLGRSKTTLYFNQSGNALAAGTPIHAMPPVDRVSQANVVDLLGTGTSCLVWSSPLANPSRNVFYIDLMGSKKPHLLTEVNNNLGAITRTTYASSTKFYLEDKKNGVQWLTRLPFPVQVVERMERVDAISGGKLVSRYSYRHGFFDGYEREFRGFARVETTDAEDFAPDGGDPLLYQSPVRTISWFHTGAWLEKERLELALQKEYFQEGPPPLLVEDSPQLEEFNAAGDALQLVTEHSIQDAREAARALKGSPLRTEVYADDAERNPTLADKPYVITETNQQVRRLQPSRGENKYGVFFAYNRESVTISSERNLSDPRVAHEMVLDVDRYGAVTRKVSLVYGRDPGISGSQPEQQKSYATLSEADHTHQDGATGTYRLGIQYESRTYEVHNLSLNWAGEQLVTRSDLETALSGATDIRFDDPVPTSGVTRRLLDRQQQTFYADDNATEAPLGDPGTRALPYKTYQLALTANQVQFLVDQSAVLVGASGAFDPALLTSEGAYLDRESNGEYWTQSGRALFSGVSQFYIPIAALDPFGGMSSVTWDSFNLLPETTTDPVGNIIQSENDYRVLAPFRITDPNLNRSQVRHDALGMVVATAVMGKEGAGEGDTIDAPTSRLTYDLLAYQNSGQPAFVHTEARETHGDPATRWQHSYAYSDGFGRVIQQKVQAEPGPAPERLPDGTIHRDPATGDPILLATNPRWVGTGRTIFNNKGNPVKQYEPFFSDTEGYEDEEDLVQWGVTPIIRYDSIDRVIRTDLPDGTFTKVEFDAWSQQTFDQNDTCRHPTDPTQHAQWYIDRGAPDPNAGEPSDPDTRAAWLSAQHADTPTTVYLDSLGRPFLSVAHNVTGTGSARVHVYYKTRTKLDIEGNTLAIYDAKQHDTSSPTSLALNPTTYTTIDQTFDVLARRLQVISPDAGTRLAIQDVAGKPLRGYNSRGFTNSSAFDAAQRPTRMYSLRQGASQPDVVGRMVYGEDLDPPGAQNLNPLTPSPAQSLNLRGRAYLVLDTAGLAKTEAVDFKGNTLRASRRLAQVYQTTPEWSALETETDPAQIEALGALETEVFTTSTTYDALNRTTSATSPASQTPGVPVVPSVTRYSYNEASLLNSVQTDVRGAATSNVVNNIDYNARGQRTRCEHANPTTGATSHAIDYFYDPETFRVTQIRTIRSGDSVVLQDLRYTYDAVGNITEVQDHADPSPVFSGTTPVSGNGYYRYDALYRLIVAQGREHPGQQPVADEPVAGNLPHPNDLQALERYEEQYAYDEVGNIDSVMHTGATNWTRLYEYSTTSNQLLKTYGPSDIPSTIPAMTYDSHGSMENMPHLSTMDWDYADRLQHTERSGGGNQYTYFTYDASGQRARKVYEHSGLTEERIYLGGFEIYRRRTGTDPAVPIQSRPVEVERETLHVMDDTKRVAMVETKTLDTALGATGVGTALWRFQLSNHLDSASLELDENAGVLSYEEYYPYGSTAFHTARAGAEVSAKRYRYTGKERDEETGLYYHGARYYAPWLGRWTSADPAGLVDGLNLYRYTRDNPVRFNDPGGTESNGAGGAPNREDERQGQRGAGSGPPPDPAVKPERDVSPAPPKEAKTEDAPSGSQDISYKVNGRVIKATLIPGKSSEVVLIYGGIHGNEKGGREVAERALKNLTAPGAETPEKTTIIVPDVFGGRQSHRNLPNGVDPNRTFPTPGTSDTKDSLGRPLPPEIKKLIELREKYKPKTIVQLHGIVVPSDPKKAAEKVGKPGVTTDPRKGHESADKAVTLAVAKEAAKEMKKAGLDPDKRMSGNALGTPSETVTYPTSDAPSQPGTTGGMYFSTATSNAPAANVILVETHNNQSSNSGANKSRAAELEALANALINVLLRRK